jgi:hypothetical protein
MHFFILRKRPFSLSRSFTYKALPVSLHEGLSVPLFDLVNHCFNLKNCTIKQTLSILDIRPRLRPHSEVTSPEINRCRHKLSLVLLQGRPHIFNRLL